MPGEDHLGDVLLWELRCARLLGVHPIVDGERERLQRGLFAACVPSDLEVRIVGFDELFAPGCTPIGVWRQHEAEGLEELCQGEELLMHAEGLAIDSPKRAMPTRHSLEECDHKLPAEGLALVVSGFSARQDFVVHDVHERGGAYGHDIHVLLLEDHP